MKWEFWLSGIPHRPGSARPAPEHHHAGPTTPAYEMNLTPWSGSNFRTALSNPHCRSRPARKVEAVPWYFFTVADDEARFAVTRRSAAVSSPLEGEAGQAALFLDVGDHRELLDVEQVLVEGTAGSGTRQGTGLDRADSGHDCNPPGGEMDLVVAMIGTAWGEWPRLGRMAKIGKTVGAVKHQK